MSIAALVLQLGPDEAERLSEALLAAGALSVDLEDALAGTVMERAIFDEPGEQSRWSRLRLTALFSTPAEAAQRVSQACAACGIRVPAYETRTLGDEDWVRRSQREFTPIAVSQRLWVVPSWHAPPDPSAVNIVLDPGLAFGTGSHASTRLCLRWLERTVAGGEAVLDYGCGSGVLAIAALKLGAGRAVGVDIDRQAVVVASANALRNGVDAAFFDPDQHLDFSADVVVANILANPLKLLAPVLAGLCRQGGSIALSGLLPHQAEEVRAAYDTWFGLENIEEEEGWISLSGVRR
jgi:ribosomal protein L11 methyltransferase